jgi:uncharacterized membrane protein YphA (DoxX/SURF4 family)
MDTVLWIFQGVLALIFATAGITKLAMPAERLVKLATWTERFSVATVRFIGIMELLGSTTVIFARALNIVPVLTPIAATGLAVIMILATIHHFNHREIKPVLLTLLLMSLSVFVAFGRFKY